MTTTRTPDDLRELAFERRVEADQAHAAGAAELGDRLDREARDFDREALRAEVADLLLRALASLDEADLPRLAAAQSGLTGLGGRLPSGAPSPAPSSVALARALVGLGEAASGLVVSHRGWPLTLCPSEDGGWEAEGYADVPCEEDGLPATPVVASGATPREALDRCADELDALENAE